MKPIQGLHHVTAMSGDAQRTLDFYHGLLGQRLVKRTVNFDDPGTYHFYFADEIGTPGTVLTFFPWPHARRGAPGNGEAAAVSYNIPAGAAAFWRDRLARQGTIAGETRLRFGEPVLSFRDPDGMVVELVESDAPAHIQHWAGGPVPEASALRGFHSVTLWLAEVEPTAAVLTRQLGYRLVGQEGARTRYAGASGDVGLYVDLLQRPEQPRGRFGAGSIHHVAFRTVDDGEQIEYQAALRAAGLGVTPVQDRQYFHSIYFREPGGVLFEVATDAPGFLYDEPVAELGGQLRLPPWLEPRRATIAAALPEIALPQPEVL